MRLPIRSAGLLALSVVFTACSDHAMLEPRPGATGTPLDQRFDATSMLPEVRLSEVHYDNSGTDVNEAVEVSGPAGTDLTGWRVVHYNGVDGRQISERPVPSPIPATCGTRGVVVVAYPVNGLQNDHEGIALVDATGAVVEFFSWENTVTAVDGAAAGMTATPMGVFEPGTTPVGHSLQRAPGGAWLAPAAGTFGACNDVGDPPPPPPPATKAPASAVTDTWVSELHYDNDGTDSGEAVEIEGPAGRSLEGWRLALYNEGVVYSTRALTGVIPATCGARGVAVVNIGGIQNGPRDGVALIDADSGVVQLLSYEGVFTATDGPARLWEATDLGVSQSSTAAVGTSLQRIGTTWVEGRAHTFGFCNDSPPPPPPPVSPLVINEIMGEPEAAPGGASWGEWFEVHNYGAEPIDLQGWTIASGGSNQPDHVIGSSLIVPAGGYAVLGRGGDVERNGGVTLDYNYFSGSTTIWLDASDWLVLRNAAGVRADSVRWTSMPRGVTRALRNALSDNTDVNGASWGYSTTEFGNGDYGTPGAANGTISDAPPAVQRVVINGRTTLPVGFQDVFGATLRDPAGTTIPTTITWSSETPALASVEGRGVVTALAAGTAILRATAADGTSGRYFLTTFSPAASSTAQYAGNAEFGEPADADASDDFIIRRAQYTLSYSSVRNTPNWVSYNLEASHFGTEDRCNCFSADTDLPSSYARILTTDYSGAGDYAGYGIDRGHLVRSSDRGAGSLDNAVTFYLSNIIPQTADQNQGPWASLETFLGNRARAGAEEIYIVTGVAGSAGTVKDEGRIVIPANVWKVALVLPRNRGLADVRSWTDAEVIAVMMPNIPGIRQQDWNTYRTTVDAIEAASGYDLLALLPDAIERVIESGTRAPVAVLTAPATGVEGVSLALSGTGSSDPDGDALSYDWDLGDGSTATSAGVSHTYAQDGSYTVRLIVTDLFGLADTASTTVQVSNVTPVVSFGGATLLPGETYAANGSFTDSGADSWNATVDYGAGAGIAPLALSGTAFALSNTYGAAGSYTVTVRVSDDDATGSATAQVVVLGHTQTVDSLSLKVSQLAADQLIAAGNATSLLSKLNAAQRQIELNRPAAAATIVRAFIEEVRALRVAERIPADAAQQLIALATRLQQSLER